MRQFTIDFQGRKLGAIGLSVRYQAVRVAEDFDKAVLALYDEYEHISGAIAVKVEPIAEAG